MAQPLAFFAQFISSGAGANGLTVTWDVERITRADGTREALVTGAATNIIIGQRGLYGYLLADSDLTLYDYVATAVTAGTADQKEIAAMWSRWGLPDVVETGVGAISWTVTVKDSGDNPLDGAEVWVTTDEAGTNVVASGITDAFGNVTFMLDAGTYYRWVQLAGYDFANPEEMEVS